MEMLALWEGPEYTKKHSTASEVDSTWEEYSMASYLTERQFESRDARDEFYQATRQTHRDTIRGSEQVDGKIHWWVFYGPERDVEIEQEASQVARPMGPIESLITRYNEPETIITIPQEGGENGEPAKETPQAMLGEAPVSET